MVVTLIMMGAVVSVFDMLGTGVAGSRATIEMSDRLRNARNLLQTDLEGLTCPTLPPIRPEANAGYFEYVEGGGGEPNSGNAGDRNDVLRFTITSTTEPFVDGAGNTSQTAEVVWFVKADPTIAGRWNLYREIRLVSGGATSLGELTKRENRLHHATDFPFAFTVPMAPASEDIVLSNVLAFDVRAYDSGAPLDGSSGTVLGPSDPGWSLPNVGSEAGFGAHVDLGYAYTVPSPPPSILPQLNATSRAYGGLGNTYCTWSFHYEHNGVNEDGDTPTDEGTNGFDDDSANGVDDVGELETSPPYPVPLRGIQITIRVYEPSSRQIRQVTVVQNFVNQ